MSESRSHLDELLDKLERGEPLPQPSPEVEAAVKRALVMSKPLEEMNEVEREACLRIVADFIANGPDFQ